MSPMSNGGLVYDRQVDHLASHHQPIRCPTFPHRRSADIPITFGRTSGDSELRLAMSITESSTHFGPSQGSLTRDTTHTQLTVPDQPVTLMR